MNARADTAIDADRSQISDQESANKFGAAGWYDLFPMEVAYGSGSKMEQEKLERIQVAVDNLLDPIVHGMAAISELQFIACTSGDYEPDIGTFRELALFQKTLAELVEKLHLLHESATFVLHKRELAAAIDSK